MRSNEEVNKQVATKPKSVSGLGKIKTTVRIPSSLKAAREMVSEQAVVEEKEASSVREVQQTTIDPSLPNLPYTQEQFMAAWENYGQQLKSAGRQGEYIVLKEVPELTESHVVRVRIANSMQQDFFEKAKPAAQLFLRKELQNRQISLDFVMVKEEESKRLYTAQEKFGYLLKKYPQLKALKDKLGLEADF